MRISVLHTTNYVYEEAVYQEPHTFRLRPRSDGAQNLVRYAIGITPAPAGQSWCLDQDGNVVLETWFDRPMQELSVASSFEVETLRSNPFDFIPAESPAAGALGAALRPYLTAQENSGPLLEFLESLPDQGGGPLTFLSALNRLLFERFAHTVREEGGPEPPETTLRTLRGTCRDLAVLFCAASRLRGIPARFVSGYECEASMQERSHMHAWAEAYVSGGGWRGYDPTQGLAVSTSHVALAAAADPRLAAPVSGTYRGSARSSMTFSIAMQVSGM
jgi:transglutaminase-like putative cysteine protease